MIFLILTLLLNSGCQEQAKILAQLDKTEETVIEEVKNYITSSGSTINQIIEESVTQLPLEIEAGTEELSEPTWNIEKAGNGYIVSCTQGLIIYQDDKGAHADGVRVLKWYYDGKNIYAIAPNDVDKEIPLWNSE